MPSKRPTRASDTALMTNLNSATPIELNTMELIANFTNVNDVTQVYSSLDSSILDIMICSSV